MTIPPQTLVSLCISVFLYPFPLLNIFFPTSLVYYFIFCIDSLSVSHVSHKTSNVKWFIWILNFSFSFRKVIGPIALVKASILPWYRSKTMHFSFHPKTLVNRSIFKSDSIELNWFFAGSSKQNKFVIFFSNCLANHVIITKKYPIEGILYVWLIYNPYSLLFKRIRFKCFFI